MKEQISRLIHKLPVIRGYDDKINGLMQQLQQTNKENRELQKRLQLLQKSVVIIDERMQKEMNLLRTANENEKAESERIKNALEDKLNNLRTQYDRCLSSMQSQIEKKLNYKYFQSLNQTDYKTAIENWYLECTGQTIDLNHPQTFNEKIQWIKLHGEDPLVTRLADKYSVRDWVEEKIGSEYLVPLFGVWNTFDEIDFDELPEKFALKANHGCGYNIIVEDKTSFDYDDARKKFRGWMQENFAWRSMELQYKNIERKIIAEEYMQNSNGELNDYKILCFNGKAKYIMFLTDRKKGLKMAFYDLEWNLMPFTYSYPRYTKTVEKPKQLEHMIELAEKLAVGFSQVRVDFYILDDGSIRFGEMTFSSASGGCIWNPPEYNRILGDMINLPE